MARMRGMGRSSRGISTRGSNTWASKERRRQARELARFREHEKRRQEQAAARGEDLRHISEPLRIVPFKERAEFKEMIAKLLAAKQEHERERETLIIVHSDDVSHRELAFALEHLREVGFTRIFLV